MEPDTAEGVVKGRSQTSTQALNAVLNGQCGTQFRCVRVPHALRAHSGCSSLCIPIEHWAGGAEMKYFLGTCARRSSISSHRLSFHHCRGLWREKIMPRTLPLLSKLDKLVILLDLAAEHPCMLLIDARRKILVTTDVFVPRCYCDAGKGFGALCLQPYLVTFKVNGPSTSLCSAAGEDIRGRSGKRS